MPWTKCTSAPVTSWTRRPFFVGLYDLAGGWDWIHTGVADYFLVDDGAGGWVWSETRTYNLSYDTMQWEDI